MKSAFTEMLNKVSDPTLWMAEIAKRLDVVPVKKTAAYTMSEDDHGVLADATGGAFAVTLLKAGDANPRLYFFKRLNGGGNAVTITAHAGETIDGAATKALAAQYETAVLLPDPQGGKWHIVSVI